jgi:hypothetical protein
VVFTSPRSSEQKSDLLLKAFLAVVLGLIHAVLTMLPFTKRSEVSIRDVRVKDAKTGQVVNVRLRGEPTSSIALGDTVAVWGRWDDGTLAMRTAYNYTTDSPVRLRKR